tara:strand:+ start:433 stop:1224 length:792 start_codon:yes stop_codon:yes gene_type:complete
MFTHSFDPVLIDFGLIEIRWYSLAYIFGILLGWWYGKKIISKKLINENNSISLKEFDNLITYIIFSIILGGRIGYVIFYNPKYYLSNPSDILKIWEGGMSFHGALIGIIIGTYLFSSKKNIKTLFFLDIISCVAPIGIFLGRIANFINGELVGKVTDLSWGVVFPQIDMMPRHPSQLYEALLEGLLLFLIVNYFFFRKNYITGTCSFIFLIFYGILRIFSEIFREPDPQLGYLFDFLSMGTLLSLIMVLIGLINILNLKKNEI